jgi:tetratricopeptide (TPR) repeat protein
LTQYNQARKYLHFSLTLYKTIGARLGEANCYADLGQVEFELENLAGAKKYFADALRIYQDIEDTLGEANVISHLGQIELHSSNVSRAEKLTANALEKYRTSKYSLGEMNCLNNYAKIASIKGKFRDALEMGKENLKIATEREWDLGKAICHKLIGDIYFEACEYSSAIENFSLAIAILPDIRYLADRAVVYLQIEDLELASKDINRALELNPEFYSARLVNGIFLIQAGEINNGAEEIDRAFKLCPENGEVLIWKALSLLILNQDWQEHFEFGIEKMCQKNRVDYTINHLRILSKIFPEKDLVAAVLMLEEKRKKLAGMVLL